MPPAARSLALSLARPLARPLPVLALAGALALGLLPAARATVLVDNLAASVDGADPVLSYGPLAASFTTRSDSAGRLDQVRLLLKNDDDTLSGLVQVDLLSDSASAPGALVATLGTVSVADIATSGFAAYGFGSSGLVHLDAGTRYWLQLTALAPVAVEWAWSTDTSGQGVAGELSYSNALGVQANTTAGAYQLQVNEVPEPASLALAALGLALAAGRRRAARG